MKKILVLVLVLCMVLSFVACKDSTWEYEEYMTEEEYNEFTKTFNSFKESAEQFFELSEGVELDDAALAVYEDAKIAIEEGEAIINDPSTYTGEPAMEELIGSYVAEEILVGTYIAQLTLGTNNLMG